MAIGLTDVERQKRNCNENERNELRTLGEVIGKTKYPDCCHPNSCEKDAKLGEADLGHANRYVEQPYRTQGKRPQQSFTRF